MICCTCSIHLLSLRILPLPFGVNTIIERLPKPLVNRKNCAFYVTDFQIDAHGAACSVGEMNIALDDIMW